MSCARPDLIRIYPADDVAVALRDLAGGERVEGPEGPLELREDIPFGHKVALRKISPEQDVIKYGAAIGHATRHMAPGSHVHTHTIRTNLADILEYSFQPQPGLAAAFAKDREYCFDGYLRPDGSAGIRNEVWVIPTVGCVSRTAETLARMADREFGGRCDGVYALSHNMGCSQMGDDQATTQAILAGLAAHPNAAGVLVVSLGCENNHLEVFTPFLEQRGALADPRRVRFLHMQEAGDEMAEGLRLLDELTAHAARFSRRSVSAEKLVLGFKCGGSDAFSGITANPLCGRVNDALVRAGGSTILTEVPEMFGAETRLMSRAVDQDVFADIVRLINDYKAYFKRYGQTIYENPSPGNKQGGISTLEEKSLGCIQKGGLAPVSGVLGYGEKPGRPGLHLLTGSGNDQVSCTNLVASGAHMVLFTTGRGTPFGTIVPTVKIASNSALAQRKPNWTDFDAGMVLDGTDLEDAAESLMGHVLAVASGRARTCNEIHGFRDISVFRDGVIL